MVVKELAAKLQIELAAKAGAALTDVLGLQLQIFLIIKSDLQIQYTPSLQYSGHYTPFFPVRKEKKTKNGQEMM